MTTLKTGSRSSPACAVGDLSESLDVRLAVAGRLSPTAIDIRRERAELAMVLTPTVPVESPAAAAAKED
jgi:hypothetical protein